MPLPISGPISLDDIHVEAGGTTGTLANINDADIRALIGASPGATMNFSDFYGAGGIFADFAYTNVYVLDEYVESSAAADLDANTPSGNSFTYQGVACHLSTVSNVNGSLQVSIQTNGTAVTFSTTDTSWSTLKVWLNQSNNSGNPDVTINRSDNTSISVSNNGTTTATINYFYSGSYSFATYFGTTTGPGQTNFLEFEA